MALEKPQDFTPTVETATEGEKGSKPEVTPQKPEASAEAGKEEKTGAPSQTQEASWKKEAIVEALKQKAGALLSEAEQSLIQKFGSVEKARATAQQPFENLDWNNNQHQQRLGDIQAARGYGRAIEDIKFVQKFLESGRTALPWGEKLEDELRGVENSIKRTKNTWGSERK